MEDTGTSEEDDDIDSQDSNTPIDHGHLARNCSIKIITPAVKPSVISSVKFAKVISTLCKLILGHSFNLSMNLSRTVVLKLWSVVRF